MVNREIINDRFKLACHRLVARRLRSDPDFLRHAQAIVDQWSSAADPADFVEDWRRLLALPVDELCRAIISRDEHIRWLRASSPFMAIGSKFLSEGDRRRLWKIMKRGKLPN